MATESNLINFSFPAAANLSAKQYHAVTVAGLTGLVDIAVDAVNCDGILQNNPVITDTCTVGMFGQSKAVAGGTVTCADLLEISGGKLITKDSGIVVAKALADAKENEIFPVLLLKSNAVFA